MRVVVLALAASGANSVSSDDGVWTEFKKLFNRRYNSDDQEQARYWIFKSNLAEIQSQNALSNTYRLAVNSFTDLTFEEFSETHLGAKPFEDWSDVELLGTHEAILGETLAASVDWVSAGAVTAVKNQGSCGSCWSFSATGALEGAWEIASGNLLSISEQQFVDCSTSNHGCDGGWPYKAMAFAKDVSLCTESTYIYQAKDLGCSPGGCTVGIPAGGVAGYVRVGSSEEALLSAVSRTPVSICLEADSNFKSYGDGVFQKDCGTSPNHAVLAVGYGNDGVDYWKVKNSWGTGWGERGYIRMIRGSGTSGKCALLSQSYYPTVNTDAPPSPAPSPSPGPQCASGAYDYCCETGTACKCQESSSASGQCSWLAYQYCCNLGTLCDCKSPGALALEANVTAFV